MPTRQNIASTRKTSVEGSILPSPGATLYWYASPPLFLFELFSLLNLLSLLLLPHTTLLCTY
jgi:hypothetical protein